MSLKQVEQVCAWAPATIANLNIGFDLLGLALTQPQERMWARRLSKAQKVELILEEGSTLPRSADKNVAGRAALSILEKTQANFGVELRLEKSILPGSGIGSSAASAVAAVVATAALLPQMPSMELLLNCALDGEELASGARHCDNVAPALYGGLVLSHDYGQMISLPVPDWTIVVLHPQVQVRTAEARSVLPTTIPLATCTQSLAWMAQFIHSCHTGQHKEAAFALKDLFVGPAREHLIPYFDQCKQIALSLGAISGGISGSGPSSFWICLTLRQAQAVEFGLKQLMQNAQLEHKTYISQINTQGAYAIPQS